MFKKLKDKLQEVEVKQSPLKSVQQLAQAVVSPSSSSVFEPSSSNDKFCIEEGDIEEEEAQTQVKTGGFTSVALRGQTTPPSHGQKYGLRSSTGSASSEANLFPVFESQPTNFHVQSDWESASEVEDRYSQLEHINKESLYEAYRKVYNRYNKMKNKYHELVTHYRQLEKEKEKAKTVLTDTQDKALLRISELREQCQLEQQAKAHLEEALRNELEERDHTIKTLKLKIHCLKNVNDGIPNEGMEEIHIGKGDSDNLIDFTDNMSVSKVPLSSAISTNKDVVDWFEGTMTKCRMFLSEKIESIESMVNKLEDARKENLKGGESISDLMIHDKISVHGENCKQEELSVYQSLITLINELGKEIKNLKEKPVEDIESKNLDNAVTIPTTEYNENSTETSSFDGTSESPDNLDKDNKEVSRLNNHDCSTKIDLESNELMNVHATIKELETENKLLNQTLKKENEIVEQLKTEVKSLKNIFTLVKSQLKSANENVHKQNVNMEGINSLDEIENDLIQDLNYFIKHLYDLKSELSKVYVLKEGLETDLRITKDEMSSLIHENTSRSNIEKNNELLSLEIDNLRKQNQELESCTSDLLASLTAREKVISDKEEELKEAKLLFGDEKDNMQTCILDLEKQLENSKKDYLSLLETKEELSNELSLLKKENGDIVQQRNVLNDRICELEKKFEQSKNEYLIKSEYNEEVFNELSSLRNEYNILIAEKNNLNAKICDIEGHLQKSIENHSAEIVRNEGLLAELLTLKQKYDAVIEEKRHFQNKIELLEKDFQTSKGEYKITAESNKQLSDELDSLKKNQEDLINERNCLVDKVNKLLKESENSLEKYEVDIEIKQKLSQELTMLNKNQDRLVSENNILQTKIDHLEKELTILKRESFSFTEEKDKLSNEILNLKKEFKTKVEENDLLQKNFGDVVRDLEESKKSITSLSEKESQLSSELSAVRQENDELIHLLNDKKSHLAKEQEKCADLNLKLNTVSESLKKKCEDFEEKCQENILFKTDFETVLAKMNQVNSNLENIKREKSVLVKSSLAKLNTLRNMKQVQKSLYDFVLQFRTEIINELDDIKLKIGNDLMYNINNIIEENACFSNKFADLECRSKKDIDSYNSKIKCFQDDEIKKSNLPLLEGTKSLDNKVHNNKNQLFDLEEQSNKVGLKDNTDCNTFEEIADHKENILNYQQILQESLLIMKALKTLLEHIKETNQCLINADNIEGCLISSDKDSKSNKETILNISKHVAAIECFITKYNSDTAALKHISNTNVQLPSNQQHNPLDVSNMCYSKETYVEPNILEAEGNSIEICLKQEIMLKDDIIKKLQGVVEEYELRNSKVVEKQSASTDLTFRPVDSCDKTSSKGGSFTENNYSLLEENKTLLETLQKVQEKYDLHLKKVIDEYEKRLEEKEEEKKLDEFEYLEKGKRYLVDEMKEQIENLQQDLDERGDAFEKLYEEHRQNKNFREEEIQKLRNNFEKDMREQDKKWRSCLDRRLAEEELRHKAEVANLTKEWNSVRKELETANHVAVSALESGSSSSDMLRRQIQALTFQLNELQNKRSEACNEQSSIPCEHQRSRSIQDCTEMEYLRNILYEYMMGKEPLVLAKVLCALMKFDDNQTKDIVLKEEQKITVLGQLGIL